MNMLNFISMLGNVWNDKFGIYEELSWVSDLFTALYPVLYAILAVIGAAGIIYAVVIGV